MLTPDLSSEDKELLYKDAMDLFSVYFNPISPDSIGLPPDIVENMKEGIVTFLDLKTLFALQLIKIKNPMSYSFN